jgi:hypothetical protein
MFGNLGFQTPLIIAAKNTLVFVEPGIALNPRLK